MLSHVCERSRPRLGLIGYGAFGRLVARHLAPFFAVHAYDPAMPAEPEAGVVADSLPAVAGCPVVILAAPVPALPGIVSEIGPHLAPGALVLDVGSVKAVTAAAMRDGLPEHVAIVATHPLFGPQSARDGIRGLKIALCEVRGGRTREVAAFLRRSLGLDVILTTPEEHDRDAAAVQGLTHLIARVMVRMEPLPTRMTTRSFDLLMQAVEMVRHDAPEVFDAIERSNPHAGSVRRRFVGEAARLAHDLSEEGSGSAMRAA